MEEQTIDARRNGVEVQDIDAGQCFYYNGFTWIKSNHSLYDQNKDLRYACVRLCDGEYQLLLASTPALKVNQTQKALFDVLY